MINHILPRLSMNNYKNIDYHQFNNSSTNTYISQSLAFYLYEIKERLNQCEQEWDSYKKITNPYEYIHTTIYQNKKCIAKYKPLSRSFFKMIEISTFFKIHEIHKPIKTFHLAEGPGGFIEALIQLRQCKDDKYIGMTILEDDSDPNSPAWKKSMQFLKDNPNIHIETGYDKTGNIISFDNLKWCNDKYRSSMDIISGDGGFDFSTDFNNQEKNISKLLFAQVAYALVMQKHNGTFILKMFDSFMQHTVDILAILSSFYKQVNITKPQTSRYANSEKYIVCTGFIYSSNEEFLPYIYNAFEKMCIDLEQTKINANDKSITTAFVQERFLNITIPHLFLSKVEEYNSFIGQQQLYNIHYTLSLICNKHKSTKIENLVKQNTQKCIQWCINNNIKYNTITNTNMFTHN